MSKVYLITGASSGFGRALAQAVLERGESAVVLARRADALDAIVREYSSRAIAVGADVTDATSRELAVRRAIERFGRIDVLANIAGRGSLGACEEFSPDQLREQMEVNFFAAAELTRAVLPMMRRQRAGHILNLTSIGGVASYPGFGPYCASKFALEGWSEALREEVRPLGIRVTIVEPGAFRTEFAGTKNMRPASPMSEYREVIAPIEQYLDGSDGKQPGDPARAALAMIAVVESDAPPLRLMLGADAFALWESKLATMQADLNTWREVGLDTTFPGATVSEIGGRAKL